MNGNFYQNPIFPTNDNNSNYSNMNTSTPMNIQEDDYNESSYIENILRLNKGKNINAHVSFPDSTEWKNKVFSGLIEEAGKDHLIIKDTSNGNWYLIRILYLDYVEFPEPINYSHSYSEKTY